MFPTTSWVTILLENANQRCQVTLLCFNWVLGLSTPQEKTCQYLYAYYCFRGTVVGSEESVSDFGKDFEERFLVFFKKYMSKAW